MFNVGLGDFLHYVNLSILDIISHSCLRHSFLLLLDVIMSIENGPLLSLP